MLLQRWLASLPDVPAVWQGILENAELDGEELLSLTHEDLRAYCRAKEKQPPGLWCDKSHATWF